MNNSKLIPMIIETNLSELVTSSMVVITMTILNIIYLTIPHGIVLKWDK
jgi:hypothetical protein